MNETSSRLGRGSSIQQVFSPTRSSEAGPAGSSTPGYDLVPDWRRLQIGDRLQIMADGLPALVGILDDHMPDWSIVWVILDNGAGRILVERDRSVILRASAA